VFYITAVENIQWMR